MNRKTSEALVIYAKKALSEGWRYWYGTTGVRCTQDLLKRKAKQYPAQYTDNRMAQYRRDIEKECWCADCINLIKGYMWLDEDTGRQVYKSNGCPDTNANGMFSRASEKGDIASMPDVPGLIVRFNGHAGVYIGNGRVIEARGFKYGIVETAIDARPWTHWYKMPGLEYDQRAEENQPTQAEANPYAEPSVNLKRGSRGEGVKWAQWELDRRGFDLGADGIDGDFGRKTDAAVRAFQKAEGLAVDGIVGVKTREKMKKRV